MTLNDMKKAINKPSEHLFPCQDYENCEHCKPFCQALLKIGKQMITESREESNIKKEHEHKFVPSGYRKPSHEGPCYHVGDCLIDVAICERCGQPNTVSTVTISTKTIQ